MKEILFEWNQWWSQKFSFSGIKRNTPFEQYLKRKEIIATFGARRSGKTTFQFQIIEHLIKTGISPEQILFVKGDDERIQKETLIESNCSLKKTEKNLQEHTFT